MSLPSNVPQLVALNDPELDAAEVSRCLDQAAKLVQTFAAAEASAALSALIMHAEEAPGTAAERACNLAETAITQTETLHDEVDRFVITTQST